MKRLRRITYFGLLLSTVLLCFSCEDQWRNYVKDSFAGKWQLRETVDNRNNHVVIDTVFYNFDKGVVKLQAMNSNGKRIDTRFGIYSFTDDSLFLEMKKPYDSVDRLRQYYGWEAVKKRFKSVKETHSEFILSDAYNRYYFRKF